VHSSNNISTNVYGYNETKTIFPLHISEIPFDTTQIDLLCVTNESTTHYCLITNFSRLVSSQTTKHEHAHYYCKRCLSQFNTEGKLLEHINYCKNFEAVRTIMANHEI